VLFTTRPSSPATYKNYELRTQNVSLMDSKEYGLSLTVPQMSARHTAQLRNAGEHVSQQTRCPQGRNTVLTSLSMHTLHVLDSRSPPTFQSFIHIIHRTQINFIEE